ncbi:MAG: RagB/SusD family nutrient uptake outer membrane protein [Bacteroidales bacterium]|nr:RagB/SusD family nutrient uptake outer membrane protein [Bacteroidales bacterium]MDD4821404.1 RagB/SusD family nutrient uptake outer membrane protein [Bacteroidales bacterium]
MKEFIKKIQYAILLALIVVMPSCSDALDIDPEDSLTQSEIYNDYKDMFTIKLGLYDIMQDLVEQSFVLGECRGDLVTSGPGAKGQYSDVAEFLDNNVSKDNKYISWAGYYHLINQCNDALVKYPILKLKQPKLETDEDLSAVYKHIVGETLWLRAWAYFKLIQNWGDVPFYTEPIYTVEQSEMAKYNTPVSQDSILNQLERDLSYSFRNCEFNWGWANLPGLWNHETVNMCAVVSLYTDVLMYRDKYQKAWDVASKIVIGGYTSSFNENFHGSFNITDIKYTWQAGSENPWFKTMFRYANENQGGHYQEEGLVLAFSIEGSSFTTERHPLTSWTNNRYSDNGLYVVKPSYPSIQMFMKQDDQVRGNYGSYLLDDKYRAGAVDTIIWKYVGLECYRTTAISSSDSESGSSGTDVVVSSITRRGVNRSLGYGNINVCRTAGLWLRAAEAANRVGLSTTAVTLMNEVRNRVGVGASSVKQNASVEEIEDALIEERALELAYEGERWYDLVSVAVRRSDPNFLIDRVVAKYPQAEKEAVRARLQYQKNEALSLGSADDRMYWWKLPRPAVYRNDK